MCAILDTNVVHEVFGDDPAEAGIHFFRWVNSNRGGLVSGGRNYKELMDGSENFRRWVRQTRLKGALTVEDHGQVNELERGIVHSSSLLSDDPHIIALAQIGGVRLLYSNDGDLQRDFGRKDLIDNPRGRVYSTRDSKAFDRRKRNLLARKDLCKRIH